MLSENHSIPLSIVKLLVGFFVQNNSEEENALLDEWICEQDINMQLFGECLEITLRE